MKYTLALAEIIKRASEEVAVDYDREVAGRNVANEDRMSFLKKLKLFIKDEIEELK